MTLVKLLVPTNLRSTPTNLHTQIPVDTCSNCQHEFLILTETIKSSTSQARLHR